MSKISLLNRVNSKSMYRAKERYQNNFSSPSGSRYTKIPLHDTGSSRDPSFLNRNLNSSIRLLKPVVKSQRTRSIPNSARSSPKRGGDLVATNSARPGWRLDELHPFLGRVTSPAANYRRSYCLVFAQLRALTTILL